MQNGTHSAPLCSCTSAAGIVVSAAVAAAAIIAVVVAAIATTAVAAAAASATVIAATTAAAQYHQDNDDPTQTGAVAVVTIVKAHCLHLTCFSASYYAELPEWEPDFCKNFLQQIKILFKMLICTSKYA